MLPEGTLIHERYQIIRQVGQGGMGAVYEAYDQRLRSHVALKQMIVGREQYGRAFEREAQLLANLRHAALPKVIDYFSIQQGSFLVMEFIPGADLAAILAERRAPFTVDDVMRWANTLLDVLDYLHTQTPSIIHRDIKPQNLKLTQRSEIILLDFGLAKGRITSETLAANTKSITGWTPQYAPLEQINGTGTDPRSDVYSLGATLYQLLTTHPPVNATARAAEVVGRRADPILPIYQLNPSVPQWINAVIMHALELNPGDRFVDAAAMRGALQFNVTEGSRFTPRATQQINQHPMPTIDPRSQTVVEPVGSDALKTWTDRSAVIQSDDLSTITKNQSLAQPKRGRPLVWIAVAFLVILLIGGGFVGGLMLTNRKNDAAPSGSTANGSSGTANGSAGGVTSSGGGSSGYSSSTSTKENEVIIGQAIYKVLGAERIPYAGSKEEMKLFVRMTWNGSYATNLNGDMFRLIVDGNSLEPSSVSFDLVDAYASQDGEVVFTVPKGISKFDLQVGRIQDETDKLSLNLDSLIKAAEQRKNIMANVPARQYPMTLPAGQSLTIESGTYKILSANLDRRTPGETALTFNISLTNNNETGMNFWGREFRLVVDGAPIAPAQAPNLVIPYQKSAEGKIVFVIPEYVRQVDLKLGKVGEKTAIVSYDLSGGK